MKRFVLFFLLLLAVPGVQAQQLRFVFLSDLHYGLSRTFRGHEASADEVNRAMAEAVRELPALELPDDGGTGAGERIGSLDLVVCGGDVANRMEEGVQPAAVSWRQFERTWYAPGMPPLWLLPGNHDISNAIGYPWPLEPARDATSAAGIYNRTMVPSEPRTAATFDHTDDRVVRTFVCSGVRFVLAGLWIDGAARAGLDTLLRDDGIPCLLFTHMEPEVEAKRFVNPRGDHSINRTDGFENLIGDARSIDRNGSPEAEYRAAAAFLKRHPAVRAWFHGHTNYQESYRWAGPDGTLDLPVFRTDSPMKGERSAKDETLLSFHVVCVDVGARRMTVREYRWNAGCWGESTTVTW